MIKILALRSAKLSIGRYMSAYGYGKNQRTHLIGKLGDGKIWELIKKYGPVVFKFFITYILPLLLALEPPHNMPTGIMHIEDDEETFLTESAVVVLLDD